MRSFSFFNSRLCWESAPGAGSPGARRGVENPAGQLPETVSFAPASAPPGSKEDLAKLRGAVDAGKSNKEHMEELRNEIESKEALKDSRVFLTGASILLFDLKKAGLKLEQLKDLNSFKNIDANALHLSKNDRFVLERLNVILSQPTSSDALSLEKEWPAFVDHSVALGDASRMVAQGKRSQPGEVSPAQLEHESTIWNYVRENPWKTLAFTGLGVTGGVLLYKWLKSSFSSSHKRRRKDGNEEAEESGFGSSLWKWTKRLGVIGGVGALLVGCASNSEGIHSWIKTYLHLDLSWTAIKRFLSCLFQGEFRKAGAVLLEGAEHVELYEKLAQSVSSDMGKPVEWKFIKGLGTQKYSDFTGYWSRGKSLANEYILNKLPVVGSVAAFLGVSSNDEAIAQEKIISGYLEKHKDKVAEMRPGPNTTLVEVLAYVSGNTALLDKALEQTDAAAKDLAPLRGAIDQCPDPQKKKVAESIYQRMHSQVLSIEAADGVLVRVAAYNERLKSLGKKEIDIAVYKKLLPVYKAHLKALPGAVKNKEISLEQMIQEFQDFAEVLDQMNLLKHQIDERLAERLGWDELVYVSVVEGGSRLTRYLLAPDLYQEYGKHLGLQIARKPLDLIVNTVKDTVRVFRPHRVENLDAVVSHSDEALRKIIPENEFLTESYKNRFNELKTKEAAGRLQGDEVAEFDHLKNSYNHAETNAQRYEKLSQDVANMNEADRKIFDRLTAIKNDRELLETQKSIALNKKSIAEYRANVAEMKSRIPPASDAEIAREMGYMQSAERNLEQLELDRKIFNHRRLTFEARDTLVDLQGGHRVRDIHNKISGDLEKDGAGLMKRHLDRIDALERSTRESTSALVKELKHTAAQIEAVRGGANLGVNELVLRERFNLLQKEIKNLDSSFVHEFTASCGFFVKLKHLPDYIRFKLTGVTNDAEFKTFQEGAATRLRNSFNKVASSQKAAAGKEAKTSGFKTLKGRFAFYGVMIGLGTYLGQDGETSWQTAAKQAAVDVLPVSGTVSDWYSVVQGKEIVTGRKLDWTDRGIRLAFGVGGLIADATSFAGVGLGIRGWISGMKEARAAGTVVREVRAAEAVRDGLRAAEAVKEASAVGRFARRVGKVGMVAMLTQLGYSFFVHQDETVEITPEVREVLGSSLEEVEDKDSGQTLSSLITQPQ